MGVALAMEKQANPRGWQVYTKPQPHHFGHDLGGNYIQKTHHITLDMIWVRNMYKHQIS